MGQAAGFQVPANMTATEYTCLECGSITGSQGINLIVYSLLNINPWLLGLISILSGAVLLPLFRWITTRPRLAADLPKPREENQPVPVPVTK
jgi:hypothetical protein